MCCTNDLCGTRRRVEWMLTSIVGTLGGGGPVGWPRMNLEMHLHLNSELASNEFLTEFAFKIGKIPSGFALVRQCREHAGHGRQDTCSYERGRACVAPAPFNFEMAPPPPPPPPPHTHTPPPPQPPPLPQSSPVVQSAALFAGMKFENPRSVLLSSVYSVL